MKKVGKTTGLVRYNLNQIPYEYTVEVKNRFKELDLVDRVPEELWIEARNIVQEAATKTIPKKRKCKKAKWLSIQGLTNSREEKGSKMQGRWGKLQKMECRLPKNSKERQEGILK